MVVCDEVAWVRIRHLLLYHLGGGKNSLCNTVLSLHCIRYSNAVLWIQIRMDPELLPGSGSGIKVPDPDPAKSERAYK